MVKHHKRPLDVTHVEQLCAKLNDMPEITNRGIISGSSYTKPAVRKAKRENVELFELRASIFSCATPADFVPPLVHDPTRDR